METAIQDLLRNIEAEFKKRQRNRPNPCDFVKWTTTRSGERIFAEDYGIRAFPLRAHSSEDHRTRTKKWPMYKAIDNGVTLACGARAGEWVEVSGVGKGRVIAVSADALVVQMESGHPLVRKGHEKTTKEREIWPISHTQRRPAR